MRSTCPELRRVRDIGERWPRQPAVHLPGRTGAEPHRGGALTSEETLTDKLVWKVVGGVAVAGAAFVAKKALDGGWRAATGNPPPTNPEHPDVAWREAIGFALLSG